MTEEADDKWVPDTDSLIERILLIYTDKEGRVSDIAPPEWRTIIDMTWTPKVRQAVWGLSDYHMVNQPRKIPRIIRDLLSNNSTPKGRAQAHVQWWTVRYRGRKELS